jgi:ribosomal protein L7/L12
VISNDTEKLHEDISKLIFTERSPKNIDTIIEAISDIVDYILANKEKVVTESYGVPNSMLSSILVEKYNEKYSESITETEKEVITVLIESTDEEKIEVYSKISRECIDLIDNKLTESDLETKDKLLRVKDKLLRDKVELNEDFSKNISKLVSLKLTLNNDN